VIEPLTRALLEAEAQGFGDVHEELWRVAQRECRLFGHGRPDGVVCNPCSEILTKYLRGTGLDVTGKKLEVNSRRKPRNAQERKELNR